MSLSGQSEKLNVCVRVRPLMQFEKDIGATFAWDMGDDFIQLDTTAVEKALDAPNISGENRFLFHRVFKPQDSTKQVYDEVVKGVVSSGIEGINGTVFAYGQTASGKTHTITGTPSDFGILPMAIRQIFDSTNESKDREYLLRICYMEIYNEKIRDLLTTEQSKTFPIVEDAKRGIVVSNLTERVVFSFDQVSSLISQAEENRHYGRTHMNEWSSRSHAIFRVIIESKPVQESDDGKVLFSTLNFVDLAGSERISKSFEMNAMRHEEGKAINKSLLFLGTVIRKLAKQDTSHIPFRDSKLTRILQSSLGGNARTSIICTISPASSNLTTSISTLKFGEVSATVKNKCEINEIDQDEAYLYRHEDQIEELRQELKQLEGAQRRSGFYGDGDMEELKLTLKMKIQHLTNLIIMTGKRKEHNEAKVRRRTVGVTSFDEQEIKTMVSQSQEIELLKEQNRIQRENMNCTMEKLQKQNESLEIRLNTERNNREQIGIEMEQLREENECMRENLQRNRQKLELIEDGLGLDDLTPDQLEELERLLITSWKRVVIANSRIDLEMSLDKELLEENIVVQISQEELNNNCDKVTQSIPQTPENVKAKLSRLNIQNNNKLCLKSLFDSIHE